MMAFTRIIKSWKILPKLDVNSVLVLHVGIFVLMLFEANGQKTYSRHCDCEYIVDGKCAYTLMVPISQKENRGSTCPGNNQPGSNHTLLESINQKYTTLQSNLSNLEQWSWEQARLTAQLQGIVLQNLGNFNNNGQTNTKVNINMTQDALQKVLQQYNVSIEILQQYTNILRSDFQDLRQLQTQLQSTAVMLAEEINRTKQTLVNQEITIRKLQEKSRLSCQRRGLLVSGNDSYLPDDSITVSSSFNLEHGRDKVRIFTKVMPGAWCPNEPNQAQEWIQFDLGSARVIYGVVTRGRQDFDQWVTSYQVQYTSDDPTQEGTKWSTFKDVLGFDQAFEGNIDRNSAKLNQFWNAIFTRYVRIVPLASYASSNKCMRADLLGCLDATDNEDMGKGNMGTTLSPVNAPATSGEAGSPANGPAGGSGNGTGNGPANAPAIGPGNAPAGSPLSTGPAGPSVPAGSTGSTGPLAPPDETSKENGPPGQSVPSGQGGPSGPTAPSGPDERPGGAAGPAGPEGAEDSTAPSLGAETLPGPFGPPPVPSDPEAKPPVSGTEAPVPS